MWNRLTNATATNGNWGEQYTFDNFGNLTGKTRSAPAMNWPGATNQTSGTSLYDANGNPYGYSNGSGPGYLWDVENHLATDQTAVYTPINYTYDPWGRRVWKQIGTGRDNYGNMQPYTGEVYFYGATGQKLETYSFTWESDFGGSLEGINIYFGGKLLQSKGVWVATDKLGSVRANSNGESMSYWPYGEERDSTANGREKFATYTRDGVGQDYAEQRYYNSSVGAFWTPDPGGIKTANPQNPGSWNRYAYVEGDPLNFKDRHGLFLAAAEDDPEDPDPTYCSLYPEDPICDPFPTGGDDPGPGPQKPKQQKLLHVTNISKSGANYNKVASTLQWILANIDPTCLNYLQSGGENLSSDINGLIDGQAIAVADFTSTIAAFTNITGTDVPDGTAAILVNNTGAFFNSGFTVDAGAYTGGTTQAQVFILLHELGHLLNANGFQSDYGNTQAGNSNDKLISTNCGATLKAAK